MIESSEQIIKLIAIYGRVSTSNQENEGTIGTQVSAIVAFAQTRNYTIVRNYLDEGWSGDSLARPALDQLRQDAKKKLWDAVLIYDPDRLARRYSYQELVMDELKEAGIEVLFVTVPVAKSDEDKIMYGMRGLFSQYERMKIAERFRLGKVRKAKENHIIASEAPYGYRFIPKSGKRGDSDFHQGYYEIDEREAEIVKKLFLWVAHEGLTLRRIVERLHDLGIPPRKSSRGVWSTSTLSRLFKNKTYIGEAHYGASYAVVPVKPLKKETYRKNKKTSRRNKPESEWIAISSPRIIEAEVFEQAQQRLKENYAQCPRHKKYDYLLAGKIWCECGCRRTGQGPKPGTNLYYRCSDRVKNFPLPPTCTRRGGVRAGVADQLVWQMIVELMSSPALLRAHAERWVNGHNGKSPNSTINVEATAKEIARLKDQQNRYTKAYGAGVITLDQLEKHMQPLKNHIDDLENQMAKTNTEIGEGDRALSPQTTQIEDFAKKAALKLKDLNFGAKQAIVREIVDKVVGTKEELLVYGYIPITSNVNSFDRHRYGANTMQHATELKGIPFEFSISMGDHKMAVT
jgi:site-specific DNA recombinase